MHTPPFPAAVMLPSRRIFPDGGADTDMMMLCQVYSKIQDFINCKSIKLTAGYVRLEVVIFDLLNQCPGSGSVTGDGSAKYVQAEKLNSKIYT